MILPASCGFFDNGDSLNSKPAEEPKNNPLSLAKLNVDCSDSDCPSFVGGLFFLSSKGQLGACSATLIDEEHVLTNSHCLPDDISFSGAQCQEKIRISFPRSKNDPQISLDCDEVIAISAPRSKDQFKSPDWAILRLSKRLDRQPAIINLNGATQNMSLTLFKMEMVQRLMPPFDPEFHIVRTNCLANTNHVFSNDSLGPFSPLINVSFCDRKLNHSNSGSGYLNRNMEVVGLHSWGSFIEDSNSEEAKAIRNLYPNIKQNFGGGTNLSCIPDLNAKLSPLCALSGQDFRELTSFYAELRQWEANEDHLHDIKDNILALNQKVKSHRLTYKHEHLNHDLQAKLLTLPLSLEDHPGEYLLLEKWFELSFLSLPSCVTVNDNPAAAEVTLFYNKTSFEAVVDPLNLTKTRFSEISQTKALLMPDLDQASRWVLKIPSEVMDENDRVLLKVLEGKPFLFYLPTCNL